MDKTSNSFCFFLSVKVLTKKINKTLAIDLLYRHKKNHCEYLSKFNQKQKT